jgi:VIT1/CCC1 family predicted Fe2+/Mn2+ transporter
MNIALWILAGLLAAAFAAAGAMKLATPKAKLEENMPWTADATEGQVKLIGLAELLGAIGLILPAVLDIAPILVPLAATGLVITMVGAAITHIRRNDPAPATAPAVVLGILALVVAVGRFGPQAF